MSSKALLTAVITFIIAFSSLFVHEGVHFIQGTIDDRVEPNKFFFGVGNNNGLRDFGYFAISYRWTTNDPLEQASFIKESLSREAIAYTVQITYIIFLIYVVYRKVNS